MSDAALGTRGRMSDDTFSFRLQDGPLQDAWAENRVSGADAGCSVVFRGTVREQARGRAVVRLEYEAYEDMVEAELRRIWKEITTRHEVLRGAIEHSSGVVPVGGCSVVVAIAAAHRAAAFAAAAEMMDQLKARVPIWKKEIYADGGEWIGQGS